MPRRMAQSVRLASVAALAASFAMAGAVRLRAEEPALAELPAAAASPGAATPSAETAAEAEVPFVPADAEIPRPPLRGEIDRFIAAKPDYEQIAAPLSTDAEFLRRATLDLIGQLPTTAETRAFLADSDPARREKLVDRLLANPAYARHMQRTVDVMLMRRLPQKHVPVAEWEAFLRKAFAENKPWDALVREVLAADGTDPKTRPAARFLLDRDGDAHEITRDVSRIFLGADVQCAQCHDHPSIDDYKQAHYYGLQAYLVRTFLFTDEKKVSMLAEKAEGETAFESVFEVRDKKSSGPKAAAPNLFAAVSLAEPKFEKGQAYLVAPDDKKKTVRPIPKFSRRSHLPEAVTSRENRRFARTTVNRFWAAFMGRGIVHPAELDHSANPPSHPELLDAMTDDFIAHGYDVKRLVREIVLSRTYQRSSAVPSAVVSSASQPNEKPKLPPEERFAQALLKPLSPAQFAWAICEATGEGDVQRASLAGKVNEENLYKRLDNYEVQFVKLFGGLPGQPPANFESTIDQVLFLANGGTIGGLIAPKAGNLADRLLKLPADNAAAIAEELYLTTLIRLPTADETAEVAAFLKDVSGDARTEAVKELVWALVTSSEFRFVH